MMNETTPKLSTPSPLHLIGDRPLGDLKTDIDSLGYLDYAGVLRDAVLGTPGPFSIGIFGNWGAGKTSLMNLTKNAIDVVENRAVATCWFNAWRYEKEVHPALPLCGVIIAALEAQRSRLGRGVDAMVRALRALTYGFSAQAALQVPGSAKLEFSMSGKDIIDRAEALAAKTTLETGQYHEAFTQLELAADQFSGSTLAIFVDDLDRCFPENAIHLLESIKLMLSQPGLVFIFGLNRPAITSYVEKKYSQVTRISGEEYLDKMFQVSFFLPDPAQLMPDYADSVVRAYIGAEFVDEFQPLFPFIGSYCRNNPRAVKRFLNNILLDRAVASLRPGLSGIPLIHFGLARALQMHWPHVADAIRYNDDGVCHTLAAEIHETASGPTATLRDMAADSKNVNSSVFRTILEERSLQVLLFSAAAREWLKTAPDSLCWSLLEERAPALPEETIEIDAERFHLPRSATITQEGKIYSTVIRSHKCRSRIATIFPDLVDIITERADEAYWEAIKWQPHNTMVGDALGWIKHPDDDDSTKMFLLRLKKNTRDVFCIIGEAGISMPN
jgi:KAP family P-loop domain